MTVVSMSYLLEAGVHFGHQTKRWNPKMKEYIFTARDEIYIIDLQKTAKMIEKAYEALKSIAANGGKVLFVGTRKQASEAIKEEAIRSESFYIAERWLGGTLTNFKTIRGRVKRLEEIERMEKDGTFELLPKKEVIGLKKEYDKLNIILCGIRDMYKLPSALFIVDPSKEEIAIKEARKLNIPVFGIVDTNCDPDMVDYIIPGNDDAIRAVKLITSVMANAVVEANGGTVINYIKDDDKNAEAIMEKAVESVKRKEPRRDFRNNNQNRPFNRNNDYRNNDYRNNNNNDNRSNNVNGTSDYRNNNNNDNRNNTSDYRSNNVNGTSDYRNNNNNDNRNNTSDYRSNNVNGTSDYRNNNNGDNRNNTSDYRSNNVNGTSDYRNTNENNNNNDYRRNVNPEYKKSFVKNEEPKENPKTEVKEVKTVKEEKVIDYSKATVVELREIAKSKEIKGYSTMKKAELLEALK